MKAYMDTSDNNIDQNTFLRSGTLYSLATNIDNHSIFLYKNSSESLQVAAKRFFLMHKFPLVGGGIAGRFVRASTGLEFVSHFLDETVEFKYILNQKGHLSVKRYDLSQNTWRTLFEGHWYLFVNYYSVGCEPLYFFAGFESRHPRVMTESEAKTKIEHLNRLHLDTRYPERFKQYLSFVDNLKEGQNKF